MTNRIIVTSQGQVTSGVDQFTNGLTTYLGELGLPTSQVLEVIKE